MEYPQDGMSEASLSSQAWNRTFIIGHSSLSRHAAISSTEASRTSRTAHSDATSKLLQDLLPSSARSVPNMISTELVSAAPMFATRRTE